MAAIRIPAPGKEYGPCEKGCEHSDCAESRRDAAEVCTICGKPIGYDTDYYGTDSEGNRNVRHWKCAYLKARAV